MEKMKESKGTRKFMEKMKESKGDNNLIGQFGVGFYSSFLVADKVTVQTKSPEDATQWVWSAKAGSHEFTVKADEGESIGRGSRITLHLKDDALELADPIRLSQLIKQITLHLKDDALELADPIRLSQLIKQYSQFISFPIKLYSGKKEPFKVMDADSTKRKQELADKKAQDAGEEIKPV
eukprot:gene25058-10709_t